MKMTHASGRAFAAAAHTFEHQENGTWFLRVRTLSAHETGAQGVLDVWRQGRGGGGGGEEMGV